jgi:hypothetical protein
LEIIMGKLSYTLPALSIGALALVCGACTTEPTQVTDVWKDPSYAGPMKNIVVFGAKLNETNRHTLEDGFVSALAGRSVRATQSYKVLPNPLPSREAARSMLKQASFDGVLVATLKGVKDEVTVVGGTGLWDGYYGSTWGDEYAVTEPVVKFETSLWDPTSGKVVWSAVTQTDNPSSGTDFTNSLTKEVVPRLEGAGLISPPSSQPISYAPAPATR